MQKIIKYVSEIQWKPLKNAPFFVSRQQQKLFVENLFIKIVYALPKLSHKNRIHHMSSIKLDFFLIKAVNKFFPLQ